ncbi:hypothetical protein ABEB36_008957 [Hypothenemus hampei]|uniref:ubiquitinyl hydrolase 1 n=1 Tax=Hypothenemus hampei TaxID=57062 RepID=A0ABD1EQT2_HYPHA
MNGVLDLYIASNLEDLKVIAFKSNNLGKNSVRIEKAIKTLYSAIVHETSDQEKLYIHCLRYKFSIDTLCRIGDKKFYELLHSSEIAKVNKHLDELEPILRKRYELENLKRNKQNEFSVNKPTTLQNINNELKKEDKLFDNEFISVKELFIAIQDKVNILIVDIRPDREYSESKIKFENIINIPEDIIGGGLSAHVLGQKLKDDTQKIWEKRDTYDALVFIDWNSDKENFTCSKLKYLKESIVEWDCLRNYKQYPVIINGGFKEFLDSYPDSVTNVHINFIRNNEDIDELLELDSISYPEPDQNISIMPLKQFTIEELEESATKLETQSDEEPETGTPDNNENQENPQVSSAGENRSLSPKGGAIRTDKPLNHIEPESMDIRSKIEEDRIKLLIDARNKKNKGFVPLKNDENKENFMNNIIGDKPGNDVIIAPPIRRDTKPKKVIVAFGGWCGLINIKNTCYMNTILQCLKCIPVIRNLVCPNYAKRITRQPSQIFDEFSAVIRVLCEGTETDKKIYKPSAFYDVVCRLNPIYKKGNHEDCMEFFLFLFNYINDDCSFDIKTSGVKLEREKAWYSHLQGRTSVWVDLFYHQFKSTKICQTCHSKADSYEIDNTLMLPVPFRPGLRMVHLKDLIDEYLEDNQILDYKCSKCQNLGVINKKTVVVAPEILVIVLKRYYQDEYQESRKNNVCVDFDFNFTFGNENYLLYSVAEHKGTMDHGHYYAHGALNKTWVEFNDERITKYTGDWDNIKGSACAFFYCKIR